MKTSLLDGSLFAWPITNRKWWFYYKNKCIILYFLEDTLFISMLKLSLSFMNFSSWLELLLYPQLLKQDIVALVSILMNTWNSFPHYFLCLVQFYVLNENYNYMHLIQDPHISPIISIFNFMHFIILFSKGLSNLSTNGEWPMAILSIFNIMFNL